MRRHGRCGLEAGSAGNIAPEYVATLIDTLASDSAIFTVDTGMCCVWGARYLRATGRRRMLGSFNHGSMANALPMAIGAAFARPGQEVGAVRRRGLDAAGRPGDDRGV